MSIRRQNRILEKSTVTVPQSAYYEEFHGHQVEHLDKILPCLRKRNKSIIFTAGDSSLDNKYWLSQTATASNGYEEVLDPPRMVKDVCWNLNDESISRGLGIGAITTAVEATTLNERKGTTLLAQDCFIRDNITEDDYLVISIGGNDIALAPTPCTVINMLSLMCCTPKACLGDYVCTNTLPCDDSCNGCGASCASTAVSFPPSAGYFAHLFGPRLKRYVEKLTEKTKPKKVLLCMIYYPCVVSGNGWADPLLGLMGYNRDPSKLHGLIRTIFSQAVSTIKIEGLDIEAVPLFEVMDGTNPGDYIQRVEPSEQGGRKMANFILDFVEGKRGNTKERNRVTEQLMDRS